jgi:hypothetical protein
MQPACAGIFAHQVVQAGLVNRYLPPSQGGNALFLLVNAGNRRTKLRKTGAGYQANVARADHNDIHQMNFLVKRKLQNFVEA